MLCRDVKRVVYFFLDGSLSETRRLDLDDHLKRCPECVTRLEIERRIRKFLQARFAHMSATAPDRLKRRLSRSIRAFETEWSQP